MYSGIRAVKNPGERGFPSPFRHGRPVWMAEIEVEEPSGRGSRPDIHPRRAAPALRVKASAGDGGEAQIHLGSKDHDRPSSACWTILIGAPYGLTG
jgi:hypothetical protein